MIRFLRTFLLVWIAIPFDTARAEDSASLARTLAGDTFEGKLVGVDSPWQLRFDVAGKTRTLPATDLVRWATPIEPERGPLVYLADGSLLVGDDVQIVDDRLLLLTDLFGHVSFSLKQVRGVLLSLPLRPAKQDQLADRIIQATGATDRLIFRNGDELSVTLGQWKENELKVAIGGQNMEVDPKQLAAIVFNPKLVAKTKNVRFTAFAGFQDGSLLHVKSMEWENESLHITLAHGQTLSSDQPGQICSLLPLGTDAVYLSDHKPYRFQHVPFLDLKWNYQRDRSVLGTRLRVDNRLYQKGIGVHSGARLTYKLDQPYQRFQAELAVDDEARIQGAKIRGSVTFRVLTTDGKRWTEAYASPTVRSGDKPIPIEVEIRNAKAIALVVDYADRGDVRDYANWLGARLVK